MEDLISLAQDIQETTLQGRSILRFKVPFERLWSGREQVVEESEIWPDFLYFEGQIAPGHWFSALPWRGLGIVGRRTPNQSAVTLVSQSVAQLKDLVIISGYAKGIDILSHHLAMQWGLASVAVVPGGFNCLYPKEHLAFREGFLLYGGIFVSEHPYDTQVTQKMFLERNRIIALLSNAVWVAQAAIPSGSLNTAMWARKLNRDVYATPQFPGTFGFEGNQRLLEEQQALGFWGARSLRSTWLKNDFMK